MDVSKGKGKAREVNGLGETMLGQPQESQYPTPSSTLQSSNVKASHTKVLLFDDISQVTAWAVAVAAAGPPEVADEVVIWSDEEPVCFPV